MSEPVPISLVAHCVFCPRRAWLEAVGERTDTFQMAVGTQAHGPSDDVSGSRSQRRRAVDVVSDQLGVVGRCDTVEVNDDASLTVVEHKSTPVRKRPEVTEPTVVQLALQKTALEEMGHSVAGCAVWFPTHAQRVPVVITPERSQQAMDWVARTRAVVDSPEAPPPLEDDPRCSRCSHVDVCLPDERSLGQVTRRILVADPDAQVVHVTTQGPGPRPRAGACSFRTRARPLRVTLWSGSRGS